MKTTTQLETADKECEITYVAAMAHPPRSAARRQALERFFATNKKRAALKRSFRKK